MKVVQILWAKKSGEDEDELCGYKSLFSKNTLKSSIYSLCHFWQSHLMEVYTYSIIIILTKLTNPEIYSTYSSRSSLVIHNDVVLENLITRRKTLTYQILNLETLNFLNIIKYNTVNVSISAISNEKWVFRERNPYSATNE